MARVDGIRATLLGVFLVFSPTFLFATWTPVGMGGGGAQYAGSFSPINPGLGFIGCDMSGWYRTTNGGTTWNMLDFYQISTDVDYGFNDGVMCPMAFHPTNPDTVYGYGRQQDTQNNPSLLLVSQDAGITWAVVPGAVTNSAGTLPIWLNNGASGRVTLIYLDPGNPNLMLIGTDNGVYQSSNGGATFNATTGSSGYICGLVADQTSSVTSRVCYAGAGGAGVFKSTNSGLTWAPANTGLPAGPSVASLAGASTSQGTRLWAVGADGNLYSSTNAANWAEVAGSAASADAGTFIMVACAANDTGTAYCVDSNNRDVYQASGGGSAWNEVFVDSSSGPIPNVNTGWVDFDLSFSGWGSPVTTLGVNPADSAQAIFSDLGENFGTVNGGATWQEGYSTYADVSPTAQEQKWASRGLEVTSVFQYAVDANTPSYRYITASDIGFCWSADSGATWHNSARRNDGSFPSDWTETFYEVASGTTAGTLFAAVGSLHDLDHSDPLGKTCAGGVIMSTNYGGTWTKASTGLPTGNTEATSIVYDPVNKLYYAAMWGSGVYKSTNGSTWTACGAVAIGTNKDVYAVRVVGGTVYCLLSASGQNYQYAGGLFVSTNEGASWTNIATKVFVASGETTAVPLYYPTEFDVNPSNPSMIFIAGQDNNSSALDYAEQLQGGCYRTLNGGTTWTQMDIPVPAVSGAPAGNAPAGWAANIDPGNTNTAYFSTENQGLFMTTDAGDPTPVWTRVTDLPFASIQHVNFGAGNLYAGAFGGGVWVKADTVAVPSSTPTPSPTANGSPTASPSRTPTPSPTPSPSATASPSPTRSPSATASATLSASSSPSPSPTRTASATLSPSASPSGSPSPASSPSPTPTGTPTASSTPALSPTPSPTPSASSSASPTASATSTASSTPTSSPSATSSPSWTLSPTLTASASATPSFSDTPTPSASATSSPSSTASPSATSTPSPTPTPSATPSFSPSPTPSPSPTQSLTLTFSLTPTLSPSFTLSPSATRTPWLSPTPTPEPGGSNRILEAWPVPNPNPSGLAVKFDQGADGVQVRIYTAAFVLASTLRVEGSFTPGWNRVALPADWSAGLPNGVYFAVVRPLRQGQAGAGPNPATMALFR